MRKPDLDLLKEQLGTIVESLGFELADISAPVVGGRLTIRLFVHSPSGVTLDDCAAISKSVSEKLDRDDPIVGRYTLEVSSLGLDRPLQSEKDYRRRIGEKIKITYRGNGKKITVSGILKGIDENMIVLEKEDGIVEIPVKANPLARILI
jgi:ribosome maturation factor RimP